MKTITRDALWKSIQAKEKLTLVEALPQQDFDKAHLPGALRIGKEDVANNAPKMIADKNSKIVVYCANLACQASTAVAGQLTALGYTDVSDYKEGKEDWIAAGHPVEPPIPVPVT